MVVCIDEVGRRGYSIDDLISCFYIYFTASPSFTEAPSDVDINEGGTVKLPCRAQGRPKTRIVWDRVRSTSSHQTEEITQLLDEDIPEDLIKSKILSFRSKREANEAAAATSENNRVPDLYIDDMQADRGKRADFSNFLLSEFNQVMRDSNEKAFDTSIRRKRNVEDNEDDEEVVNAADTVPVLFFSTQAPFDGPRLEVNDNGELILRDVSKKDEGWYACAALNEAGSAVKRVFIRVQRSGESDTDSLMHQTDGPVNRFSNDQNIIINTVAPMNPNSLDVFWETNDDMQSNTLTVHYRVLGTKDFQTKTAMIDVKEFTIGDLKAHTEYEIFVSVPEGLGGSVSNIRRGKTFDGPPTAPPTDVRVGVINNTAAYVRWSPPPTNMLNGELTGYKVNPMLLS